MVEAIAAQAAMADAPGTGNVNRDIVNALGDLVKRAGTIAQSIAALFGIAPSDLLALFKLDEVMTMKELAQRMACDASFITGVADTLERRGLVRREPSPRDRRAKNLVLTPEGVAAKERMLKELAVKMPWCYALNDKECHVFLGLLQKMLAAEPQRPQEAERTKTSGGTERTDGGEPVTTAAATTS